MERKRVPTILLVSLMLISGCENAVMPEPQRQRAPDTTIGNETGDTSGYSTSRPWKQWTPEQKQSFLQPYLRTLQHGDDAKLAQMVELQLDNIPSIVTDLLESSDMARRWGEIGWNEETYTADEWVQAAESMAALYAEKTGDADLQEQVTNYKMRIRATELGDEGYEALDQDPELALTKFFEALEIFRAINAPVDEAQTLLNIGVVYFGLAEYEQALIYHEQALAVAEQEGAYSLAADILCNLAPLYHLQGQPEKGNAAVLRALEIAEASGDESKYNEIRERLAPFLEE